MNCITLEELKKYISYDSETYFIEHDDAISMSVKYKLPIVSRVLKILLYPDKDTNRRLGYLQISPENIFIDFDNLRITIKTEHFEDTFKIVELPFPHLKYEKYDYFIEDAEQLVNIYRISFHTSIGEIVNRDIKWILETISEI